MAKQTTALTEQDKKRYTRILWQIVIAGIVIFTLFIFSIGLGLFGDPISFRDIEHPKSNLASEILGDDGQPLGTYYVQNRSNSTYKEISPAVINALIATEDVRFHEHSGIDFKRTFSIIFYNLIGKRQGASTITQQLAKNLWPRDNTSSFFGLVTIKFKEWITAVKLERNYTKEEIITMYLNTVDFGNQSFGIKSAARTYFNTNPDKLTTDQSAMLIGILKGASFYSPTRHADRALSRRNTVLENMNKANLLTEAELTTLKTKPLGLHFTPSASNEGPAPYFRAVLKSEIKKIFQDRSITKADGTPYDLDRDGIKIYTTINRSMQQYAEEAQREYMKDLQAQFIKQYSGRNPFKGLEKLIEQGIRRSDRYKELKADGKTEEEIKADFNTPTQMSIFSWRGDIDTVMKPIDSIKYYKMLLRNAMMTMDPATGHVKAWVGGNNFNHFKYDQVKMGSRQVGSTAKPFTYAVAIENGYSPCLKVMNEPVTIEGYGEPWTPRSTGTIPGYLTLRQGLANSQNWITAWVMKQVGPVAVASLIKKMGVTSDVKEYPSIALGSFDASVYDMTGAYSAFVNHGVWTEPIYLLKITDKNGNILYEGKPKVKVVMNEEVAYTMTYMLKGVVEYGTGSRLRWKYNLTNPIGGKTGTTNANSDGWFMGVTPQLVSGIWTGCEDRDIHFLSTRGGDGASTALPIFAGFIKRVYADPRLKISKGDFEKPKNGTSIEMNCDKYNNQEQGKTELDEKLGF